MAVTFSEQEIKKLILALAGSKEMPAPEDPKVDEEQESPDHEADPKDSSEDAAEGEAPDKKGSAGVPHGESTKAMLERKLKEK